MKKLFILVLVFIGLKATSQNLQVLYDLGEDRQHVTTTVEMFRPDNYGNTFFFVDMNYGGDGVKGVSLAYWEIARVFSTKKFPLGLNVEYNGGFGRKVLGQGADKVTIAYPINNAWLIGPTYSMNAKDFSKGFTVKALYKAIEGQKGFGYQLTGVWYIHFLNRKMTFNGFADFWRQDSDFDFDGKVDATHIFLAEPQLWYHINKHFDIGGEIELSNNFALTKGFKIRPAPGIKWKF